MSTIWDVPKGNRPRQGLLAHRRMLNRLKLERQRLRAAGLYPRPARTRGPKRP